MELKKALITIVLLINSLSYCRIKKLDGNDQIKKILPESVHWFNGESYTKDRCRLTLLVDDLFLDKYLPEQCRIISRSGNIISAICPDSLLSALDSVSGVRYIKSSQKIDFLMDSVRVLTYTDEVHGIRPSNLPEKFTGKGVLFGIILTNNNSICPLNTFCRS